MNYLCSVFVLQYWTDPLQQIYNVKAVPDPPLQNLDLTRADDDEFSPDKLRATLERFYTTVVVTLTSVVKHVARLRSWKEPRRTAFFCAVRPAQMRCQGYPNGVLV